MAVDKDKVDPIGNATIASPGGGPTVFFATQWQKLIALAQTARTAAENALAAVAAANASETRIDALEQRNINTVGGIQGGGNLTADRTLSLVNTGVVAGTYGSATQVAQITVGLDGRLTNATNVTITGGGGGGGPWWFAPPTLASLPTVVNDGPATGVVAADDTDAGLLIRALVSADGHSYARLAAAPAAPYTVTCKVHAVTRLDGHYTAAGIVLREAGTGRKVLWGWASNDFAMARRNQNAAGGTDIFLQKTSGVNMSTDGSWLRLLVAANYDVTIQISPEGKQWYTVASVTAATGGWTALDQAGVGIFCRVNPGLETLAAFEHYTAA